MGARHSRPSMTSGGNKKMDTVTLAKQERERQGPWEVEVSYGGEVDLHRHLDGCEKNPGHQKFIPVDQFNVDHLPPGYHGNDLVEYIRAQSDVTVRVSVKYVSERRPETFPGSDKPYPSYRNRGSSGMMMVGTGWVWGVRKYPNDDSNHKTCDCKECLNSPTPKTCTCKECLNSPTPKPKFAYIDILTAAHVVYDDLEAAHTTCHLFFDKGGTPDVCSGVVTLSGMSCEASDIESDWCRMRYVTYDLDLADRLDKMVAHREDLYERITDKYDIISHDQEKRQLSTQHDGKLSTQHDGHDGRLVIIVSHPHGCSKQVSEGHWVSDDEDRSTYTTATCPGSSGAYVYGMRDWGLWLGRVHSGGNCEANKQLNYSHRRHY